MEIATGHLLSLAGQVHRLRNLHLGRLHMGQAGQRYLLQGRGWVPGHLGLQQLHRRPLQHRTVRGQMAHGWVGVSLAVYSYPGMLLTPGFRGS